MAQKHIELGLKYMRTLNKRKIDEESKDKVKRRLFCDERAVSPGPVQHTSVDNSNDIVSDGSPTIFFIGYKFPSDYAYKCEECFVGDINSKHKVEIELYLHSNRSYGERNFLEYKREGYSESDSSNFCEQCKIPLYVIRPYHSSHLDFA